MKKILILFYTGFVVSILNAQATNTENYIQTRKYLEAVTSSSSTAKQQQTVQYFDGLGRPKQIVNVKASPLSKDVVVNIEYDGFGRQALDYLPVPQTTTGNGGIVSSPLSNATQPDIYGSEKIYAEKIFESSPLDRVLSQKQVGNAWDSKPVTFGYDANVDGEVKKYVATFDYTNFTSTLTLSATGYGANQLYKNTVTDEDGNATIEFKNGAGQVILVRKMLDTSTPVDTYYVYNDYNQLAYVIPPLAVVANNVDESTTLANLCYQYKYDSRNRLVEKKLPGKDWEYMVYDKQDRLVLTQDANLRLQNRWLYTKYDQFGRVLHTGISDGSTRSAEQTNTDAKGANNEYRLTGGWMNSGMEVPYSNGSGYPNANIYKVLSINFYDTYPTGTPVAPTTQTVLSDDAQNNSVSTKSLPVASYVKNIENDNWTKNYTWYDQKGRTIASHSINHLGGYTKTESVLDFAGSAQQTVNKHKRLSTDTERIITENFTYDHQNRLLTHTHKVDNGATEYLAQNEYNELSQLKTKKVGGQVANNGLQTIDYSYNIRGWMMKINDPQNLNGKLFGYELRYNNPENTASSVGRFNGNIAEATWKTSTDNWRRRYNYQYDGLNRLLTGIYSEPEDLTPQNNYYNETLTYDRNGNILTLVRNTKDYAGLTPMDNLTYVYSGNKLTNVTDSSMNYSGYPDTSGITILYDANGNMTKHEDKGILEIGYNHLNLPNYNKFNQAAIRTDLNGNNTTVYKNTTYLYRADGVKLKKIHQYFTGRNNGSDVFKTTEYLDGFQYEVENTSGHSTSSSLKFIPTTEGYYNFENNKYIYQYKDHIGNVRVSYYKDDNGNPVIEKESNYYPFGLEHSGYNFITSNSSYNYGFQEQEKQIETGWNSFKWRNYDPTIGRFFNIDPLSEKYAYQSHYNFSENRVIDGRELEGLEFTRWDLDSNDPNVIFMKQTDGVVNYRDSQLYQQFNETRNSILEPFWVALASMVPEAAIEEVVITAVSKIGFFGRILNSVKGVFSSKSANIAEDIAEEAVKKVPNPYGKAGGPAHQAAIDEAEQELVAQGFTKIRREVKVETPNGAKSKRFVDIEGTNPTTNKVKQIQVGKQNKNGTPVSRERKAMDDIETATGTRPEFKSYNPINNTVGSAGKVSP